MGEVKPAEYYNNIKPCHWPLRYKPPWEGSGAYERLLQVVEELDRHLGGTVGGGYEGRPVVDIGCGIGTLAAIAWHEIGHREEWIGYDFAPILIRQARRGNRKRGHQNADFKVRDLVQLPVEQKDLPQRCLVVATEILEHIEDDIGALRRLGAGTDVLLTVPIGDAPGHVRTFATMDSAIERYRPVLRIERKKKITLFGEDCSWLLKGKIRG